MGSEDPRPVSRPKVISVLKKSFEALCAPGGRYLTVDNIHRVLQPFGLTEDGDVIDLIRQAQLTDNGRICYDEFDKILKNKLEDWDEPVEDCVRNAFDLLDYDKNGYITIPELFHLFGEVGEMWSDQDLYEVVKAGDIDGDGRLDLEDFFKFLGYNLTPRADIQQDLEEVESRWPPTIEKVQEQAAGEQTEACGGRPKSGYALEGESIITVVREAEDAGLLRYSRRNSREKYPLVRMATEEELPLLLQRQRSMNYGQKRRSNSLFSPDNIHFAPQAVSLVPRPRTSSALLWPGGFAAFPREKRRERRSSLECNTLSSLSLVRKLETHLKQNSHKNTQSNCPKAPVVSRRGSVADRRGMSKGSDTTKEKASERLVNGGVVKMPTVEQFEDTTQSTGDKCVDLENTIAKGQISASDEGKGGNEHKAEEKIASQKEPGYEESSRLISEMCSKAEEGFSTVSSLTCDADQSSLQVEETSEVEVLDGSKSNTAASGSHSYVRDEENCNLRICADKPYPCQTLSEANDVAESLVNVVVPWGQEDSCDESEVSHHDSLVDNYRSSTPREVQIIKQDESRGDHGNNSDGDKDGNNLFVLDENQGSPCESRRLWPSSPADSLHTPSPPATPLWGDPVESTISTNSLLSEAADSTRMSEVKRLNTVDIKEFARRVEETIQQRLQISHTQDINGANDSLTESPRTSEDLFLKDEDSFEQDKMSLKRRDRNTRGFSKETHTRTIKDSSPDSGFDEQTLGSLIRKIDENFSPRNKYHVITKERDGMVSPVPLAVRVNQRPNHTLCQRKLGVLPYRNDSCDTGKIVTHPSRLYKQSSLGRCMGVGLVLPGQNQGNRRIKNEDHKGFWKASCKLSVEKGPTVTRRNKQTGAQKGTPAAVCRQINLTLGQSGSGHSLLRYQSLSRSMGQGRQLYGAMDKLESKKVKKQPRTVHQSVIELQFPEQVGDKPIPKKLSLLSSLPKPFGRFYKR